MTTKKTFDVRVNGMRCGWIDATSASAAVASVMRSHEATAAMKVNDTAMIVVTRILP